MIEEPTNVTDNVVVSLEYVLNLEDGREIDRSESDAPLKYLQGFGNIIPGLENALYGMAIGEEKKVVVPAEEAYGERDPEDVVGFPRATFPPSIKLVIGEALTMRDSQTDKPVRALVKAVKADEVVLDFNHPLAGKTLVFDVKITGLRNATQEELSHGHVHEGGHVH